MLLSGPLWIVPFCKVAGIDDSELILTFIQHISSNLSCWLQTTTCLHPVIHEHRRIRYTYSTTLFTNLHTHMYQNMKWEIPRPENLSQDHCKIILNQRQHTIHQSFNNHLISLLETCPHHLLALAAKAKAVYPWHLFHFTLWLFSTTNSVKKCHGSNTTSQSTTHWSF